MEPSSGDRLGRLDQDEPRRDDRGSLRSHSLVDPCARAPGSTGSCRAPSEDDARHWLLAPCAVLKERTCCSVRAPGSDRRAEDFRFAPCRPRVPVGDGPPINRRAVGCSPGGASDRVGQGRERSAEPRPSPASPSSRPGRPADPLPGERQLGPHRRDRGPVRGVAAIRRRPRVQEP